MMCAHCRREIADYSNFCYFCGARQIVSPGMPPRAHKRLMRSAVDRRIFGVCGGIAEYLEVDSTVVRLICVVAALLPVPLVPAVVAYFVAWIIMPLAPLPERVVAAPPDVTSAPHSTPA